MSITSAPELLATNETLFGDPLHANDSQRTDLKQSLHKTKPIVDYYMRWDLNESSRSLFIALSKSAETDASAQSTPVTAQSDVTPVPQQPNTGSSLSADRQPHEEQHSVPGKSLKPLRAYARPALASTRQ